MDNSFSAKIYRRCNSRKSRLSCGFCATKRLAELKVHHETKTEPSHAEITKNMKNSSLCATIVEQVKAEEKQQTEKSNNLVIRGLKADKDQTDKEMLTDLASAVSVTLKEDEFTTHRIKNKNNANANPLLIITFKDAITRLKLLKSSKKLMIVMNLREYLSTLTIQKPNKHSSMSYDKS